MVLEESRAVAAELGLPPWWLNEQASVYVAPGGDAVFPDEPVSDRARMILEDLFEEG